jgi:hypothetical protein
MPAKKWESSKQAGIPTRGGGAAARQMRRGQGESNERLEVQVDLLEALLTEQQRTNQLLEWIGTLIHQQGNPEETGDTSA